jgi:hypothetical protein
VVGIEAAQDDKEDLLLVADSTHLSTVRRLVIFSIKYVNYFFVLHAWQEEYIATTSW